MSAERVPLLIVSGGAVTLQNVTDAFTIDERAYPKQYQVTLDECLRWYRASPDIYMMLLDGETRNVIGYINAMPLEDGFFELLKDRRIDFLHIPDEKILRYDKPGYYKLYITSVALDPARKSAVYLRALLDAFVARLIELSTKGIFVSELLADAVSNEGARLCAALGMQRAGTSGGIDMYRLTMLPPGFAASSGILGRLGTIYEDETQNMTSQ